MHPSVLMLFDFAAGAAAQPVVVTQYKATGELRCAFGRGDLIGNVTLHGEVTGFPLVTGDIK